LTYHDPPPEGGSTQDHYLSRHLPAQVNEALRYVENQSIFLDLKVIVQIAYCILVYSWRPPKKKPVTLDPEDRNTASGHFSGSRPPNRKGSRTYYATSKLARKE
jgi:hypothetical protein